jgi:biopolymer transport protein ExbB/TolQ
MIFPLIKTYIYLISAALFYPVVVLLAGLSIWVLLLVGMFVADGFERLRLKPLKSDLGRLSSASFLKTACSHTVRSYHRDLRRLLATEDGNEIAIENLLQHYRLQLNKRLDRLMILVRIGPGLGLIGTLIPMGTGLAALGQGDMTRLSADLVIAFTTTVVGMAVGLIAFVLYTVQKRWQQEDLRYMEIMTELDAGELQGEFDATVGRLAMESEAA